MKNYQKNSRNPSVPFSCMFEQCLSSFLDKTNKGHLNNHIWSWNLNHVSKQTSFKLLLVALAQITAYCHVMIMHHILALHWLCSFLVAGVCPLSVDMCRWRERWHRLSVFLFRSVRQAKPPCSFRYNPTLSLLLSFTALVQQRFNCYMLR